MHCLRKSSHWKCRKKLGIAIWKRFDSSRQSTVQHSSDEMVVAENGPLLHHNDEILKRAINQYWRVANMISDSKWYLFAERRTYVHMQREQRMTVRLSESCWIKSLNYHLCKTVHVNKVLYIYISDECYT